MTNYLSVEANLETPKNYWAMQARQQHKTFINVRLQKYNLFDKI